MYSKWQEFVAELLGTMFIVLFGTGVDAMNTLFGQGGYTNICIGWGLGVFLGILISNRISGAHLNPVVSIALAITKRCPWAKLPHYIFAQMLGGFLGAAIVYAFYLAKFNLVDPGLTHTAGIFVTQPAVPLFMPEFIAEVIATAILLFGILGIVEHFATEKAGWLAPFAIASLIVAIGMSFGGMDGYAMNPARDISPRIFTVLIGFKDSGFANGSLLWLAPLLGPIIGGPLGAVIYHWTVGRKENSFSTDEQSYQK